MNKTLLIVGIVLTGLSLLSITVFSISKFILKRIYKEEETTKTSEQKAKDKAVKRSLKISKAIMKKIFKKLVDNYVTVYLVTALSFSAGVVVTTTSAVKMAKEDASKRELSSSMVSSEEVSENSSLEESSEENSSQSSVEESSESTSLSVTQYNVSYSLYSSIFHSVKVDENTLLTEYVPDESKLNLGDVLEGWYLDEEFKDAYDYSKPVTSDLTLYGKLGQGFIISYYYILDGFEEYHTVRSGECAPNVEYYTQTEGLLVTWYAGQEAFDFTTPIESNYSLEGHID